MPPVTNLVAINTALGFAGDFQGRVMITGPSRVAGIGAVNREQEFDRQLNSKGE